jgi:hypothetical protein
MVDSRNVIQFFVELGRHWVPTISQFPQSAIESRSLETTCEPKLNDGFRFPVVGNGLGVLSLLPINDTSSLPVTSPNVFAQLIERYVWHTDTIRYANTRLIRIHTPSSCHRQIGFYAVRPLFQEQPKLVWINTLVPNQSNLQRKTSAFGNPLTHGVRRRILRDLF